MREMLRKIEEFLFGEPAIPPWIRLAKTQVGIKEIRGGENPEILKYFKATNLRATEDEVPWCSAAMNWIMQQCHMVRSGSAAARSWLGFGTRQPGYRKYSIVVLRRGNSSWQGHVAFAVDRKNGMIQCLGGNQADQYGYAWFSEKNVLGYFWPIPEHLDAPIPIRNT
jgi:uncharacterized protein (TIGR02594 family)